MINSFFSARNYLATHIIFTLFCCVIGFLLVGYPLIMTDSLYHDNSGLYSFYRNSFLSVLHFGEIRWWDPGIQYGFPSYYFSFLGLDASTPLFRLTEAYMYLLHLLGVRNIAINTVIVVYLTLLIPLLFNLSFLALTRQIFKKNTTFIIAGMMAAFSPGLIYSVGEAAFGLTAYGMLVAATLLSFVRNSSKKNYLLLNITLCILLLSFNHLSLFWNALFLLTFGIALLLFPERSFKDIVTDYISLPLWQHILFCITIVLSIFPTLFCYLAGTEIARSGTSNSLYDPLSIFGGDPLEFFLAGIPGFGTVRQGEVLSGIPKMIPSRYYLEYPYMGMLSIPLALLGLVCGQKVWRHRLYFMMSFFVVAVLLGGKSGILSIFYLAETPLRAVRHLGDTTFRNGLFALIIIAAGLGVDVLVSTVRSRKVRNIFMAAGGFWLSVICAVIASVVFLAQYGKMEADIPTIGYIATLVFFYIPVILWLYFKPGVSKPLRILICVIIFIDLTSSIYLFVRKQILPTSIVVIDDNSPFSINNLNPRLSVVENTLLTINDLNLLKESPTGIPRIPYLGLTARDGVIPVTLSSRTFNSIEIKASAVENSKLFWRDSWFNGWEATVNGRKVAIEKFLGAFKAVPVSSGDSIVRFEFFPRKFVYSLIIGWASVFLLLAILLTSVLKRSCRNKSLSNRGLAE